MAKTKNRVTSQLEIYYQSMYSQARAYYGDLLETGTPGVLCSPLPSHWRSNKALPKTFKVVILSEVEDGTLVTISAGNDFVDCGQLRNNQVAVRDNVAKFGDLRFIDRSGRGKLFQLSIQIDTKPNPEVATYPDVIKISVDGPRKSRTQSKCAFPIRLDPWRELAPQDIGYYSTHPDTPKSSLYHPEFLYPVSAYQYPGTLAYSAGTTWQPPLGIPALATPSPPNYGPPWLSMSLNGTYENCLRSTTPSPIKKSIRPVQLFPSTSTYHKKFVPYPQKEDRKQSKVSKSKKSQIKAKVVTVSNTTNKNNPGTSSIWKPYLG